MISDNPGASSRAAVDPRTRKRCYRRLL